MMISFLPSVLTEYFKSFGADSCFFELSDIFLSKGGSKQNTYELNENSEKNDDMECSLDSLAKFQTMMTCVEKNQILEQLNEKYKYSKRLYYKVSNILLL